MDIWKWVDDLQGELFKQGEHRLARSIDLVPEYAYTDEHDALDALYPEALAGARRLGLPWLEIYLRHWHLRSRVGRRMEAGRWLGEAVDLLEFAHRPQHVDCPQSVCATQDVAGAYEIQDHVGFAPERMQVAREALERITPRWQCFLCISDDYANALIDAGRPQEALRFLDEQAAAITGAENPAVGGMRVAEFCGKSHPGADGP